jgi:alpha-beta hydrolase superfamily lysophospholipase
VASKGEQMEIDEWKWKTKDGLGMYSKAWEPTGKAKGVICVIHGVGEHIGRYEADGEAMAANGYIQTGFDLRGFGRSQGKRGHTPSIEVYFDDIDLFLAEVARRYPGLPYFLYGMSMGGVIVLAYTPIRQPAVSGVISTAPALHTLLREQKFKVFLAKSMGNLFPTLTVNSGIDASLLSHDPRVVELYQKDPLVHAQVTAAWGAAMLRTVNLVYENAAQFPLPLLLMHGTEDQIAYPSSSLSFYELAPKETTTLKMWQGFRHELRNEPGRAKVFKFMIDWMDQQINS